MMDDDTMQHIRESKYNEFLWMLAILFIALGVVGILSLSAFLYVAGYV